MPLCPLRRSALLPGLLLALFAGPAATAFDSSANPIALEEPMPHRSDASDIVTEATPRAQRSVNDILRRPLADPSVRPSLAVEPSPEPVLDPAALPIESAVDPAATDIKVPDAAAPEAKPAANAAPAIHGDMPVPSDPPPAIHRLEVGGMDTLPPVTPEAAETTMTAPIPPEAVLPDAAPPVAQGKTPIHRVTVEEPATVSNNATMMRGPVNLAPAPVPDDLKHYQFLPLFAKTAAPDSLPLLWPILSSRPLAANHSLITRAVIVIHDATRDSGDTLRQVMTVAGPGAVGVRANTLILAPLFPIKSDRAAFKPLLTDAIQHVAAWDIQGWWRGDDTVAADNQQRAVSSMAALDMLLLALADTKLYPELRSIVIAGYGRGADLVQRYALYGRAHDIIAQQHIGLHYLAVDPQSYAYLTEARPGKLAGVFTPPKDNKTCPGYQNYPYGLEAPNPYAGLTAGNVARQNYVERQMTYLVGDNDTGPAADQNCGAALQGKSVKERAVNFNAFLKSSFGETPKQQLLVMPGMGDDPLALLTSNCGASLLFSDGECLRAQSGVKN